MTSAWLKTPVKILGNGRYRIDVLALRDAIRAGTLKPGERAIVEKLLPGVCSTIEQKDKEPEK